MFRIFLVRWLFLSCTCVFFCTANVDKRRGVKGKAAQMLLYCCLFTPLSSSFHIIHPVGQCSGKWGAKSISGYFAFWWCSRMCVYICVYISICISTWLMSFQCHRCWEISPFHVRCNCPWFPIHFFFRLWILIPGTMCWSLHHKDKMSVRKHTKINIDIYNV